MHYILCSDNRITYTLIINDCYYKGRLASNIHEYLDVMKVLRVEDWGVEVDESEPTPITRGWHVPSRMRLDKPAKMTGIKNGVLNDVEVEA